MPDSDIRQEEILKAAADVIIRLGYDKTSMSDIAAEAGISRGTVYLYFKGKEELFEALVYWEWMQYAQIWMQYIEADPRGGTVGGVYRATFHAINSRPLIASMLRRDRRIIGSYIRKPDNLFAWMESGSVNINFIQALQMAGAIRQNINPKVVGQIIDMLSYGYLMIEDIKRPEELLPSDEILEAVAEMMDRMLMPDGGGNSEAGKAVIRELTAVARTELEKMKKAKDKQHKVSDSS